MFVDRLFIECFLVCVRCAITDRYKRQESRKAKYSLHAWYLQATLNIQGRERRVKFVCNFITRDLMPYKKPEAFLARKAATKRLQTHSFSVEDHNGKIVRVRRTELLFPRAHGEHSHLTEDKLFRFVNKC